MSRNNNSLERGAWSRSRVATKQLPLIVALGIALSACGPAPIGLRDIEATRAYREGTQSALTGPGIGIDTLTTLRRRGLSELYRQDPPGCIQKLQEVVGEEELLSDELFALAELSLRHAGDLEARAGARPPSTRGTKPSVRVRGQAPPPAHFDRLRREARSYYLAAAVYAFAFLFPKQDEQPVPALDPRTRIAADLYARGLAGAFSEGDEHRMYLASGSHEAPFGTVQIAFDEAELQWGSRMLDEIHWVGAASMYGLNNRYRDAGLGTPVSAKTKLGAGTFDFVARSATVPATVVLLIDSPRKQLRSGRVEATLEVHTANETRFVEIDDTPYPLEFDASAALADSLERSRFWESQFARFLGRAIGLQKGTALTAMEPYVTGRIPVVFIHGTDSSAATWANTVNDLQRDPRIRDRFHFWFFSYESGNNILYSGMLLRNALNEAVERFRQAGGGRCLDRMMIVGHSQGGLLTKLMAVSSGTAMWDTYFNEPFDEVPLTDRMRAVLEDMAFFEPLPYVRRVVFMSTPHRGSFIAGRQLVRRLAARAIQLPREVVALSADRAGLDRYLRPENKLGRLSTAVDNMSPSDAFIRTSSQLAIDDRIRAHSIIALLPGESKETGDDGVVRYSSAHLDDVESELIVRSGHSVQSKPEAIEELRRILLLHANEFPCHVRRPQQIDYPGDPLPEELHDSSASEE